MEISPLGVQPFHSERQKDMRVSSRSSQILRTRLKNEPAVCEALNMKAVGTCECVKVYKPPVYLESCSSFVLTEAKGT